MGPSGKNEKIDPEDVSSNDDAIDFSRRLTADGAKTNPNNKP